MAVNRCSARIIFTQVVDDDRTATSVEMEIGVYKRASRRQLRDQRERHIARFVRVGRYYRRVFAEAVWCSYFRPADALAGEFGRG